MASRDRQQTAQRTFFARTAWFILAGFALAAPGIFYAAARAVGSNTNKVEDWLPASFSETGELGWFRQHFVGDQFVVISWDGCRLGDDPRKDNATPDDPRIERLAQALVPTDAVDAPAPAGQPHAHYFKAVTTARRLLNQLTAEPMSVPYDQAVKRLTGSLVGPDGKHTCVIVTLSNEAVGNFRKAIGRPRTGPLGLRHFQGELFDILEDCSIEPDSARLGGPPVDNVAIDEEGERTLIRLAGLAGLLGLGLAWFSLRSIKLTLIVFACGILSAAGGLAAIWLSGGQTDAVVLSMPALVYVLAISGAVHLINYYHEAVEEHGLVGAPERAIAHGWKPALLCSVTTALGLLSLYASDLVPIRKFGVYSATAMMLMLVVLFLYLPAALQIWPVRRWRRKDPSRNPTLGISSVERFWERFASGIIRHNFLVFSACVLVITTIGFGLTRVRTSIDLMKLFDGQARILRDYQWLEAHVGRLVPMELVLKFAPETLRNGDQADAQHSGFTLLERLEIVNDVQRTISQRFGAVGEDVVGPSVSAVTFVPPLPERRQGTSAVIRRSVTNSKLEGSYDSLLKSGYLRLDPADGTELWRVSLRVAAFQDVDYGLFSSELREVVEPVLQAQRLRRKILDRLTAARQGQSYVGANVLLWHQPALPPAANSTNPEPSSLTALAELLQRDRVRIVERREDVAAVPLMQLQELRQFDCVVLERAFAEPDMQMLHEVAPNLVCLQELEPQPTASSPELANARAARSADDVTISAVYTGVVPIVYKAQRALLDSLIQSTLWSFLTITPLLMFVTRGVAAGAVAMLPNVLPVVCVFGGMGWLNLPVDIGSMMSASIALGVAVDDTIHYLTWFREDLNETRDRRQAIVAAYRKCATPTLQAALISGLGLSVFAFSTFTPTQQFGYLMLTILIAGVVAELVMLPAILAGPLGAFFRPIRIKSHASSPPAPHLPLHEKETRCSDASPTPLAGSSPGSRS